jgi:hypothetical protein
MSTYREAARQSAEIHQSASPPSPIAINYKWQALARVMYLKQSNPKEFYKQWREAR